MPGTAAGTVRRRQRTVASATCSTPAWLGHSVPAKTMLGFEQHSFEENTVSQKFPEDALERGCGHFFTAWIA